MDLRVISPKIHPQIKILECFNIFILENYQSIHSLNYDQKFQSSMAKLSGKLSNQNSTLYKVMKTYNEKLFHSESSKSYDFQYLTKL